MGTGCTRTASPRSCSARRSGTARRSARTSPRAGCGRTWSAAAVPSASVLAPRIAGAFGTAPIAPEALFRAVNRVHPSLIRVEADEATYGLHIVLRFELEQELIENRLAVADLPEAWNARVRDYLGIEVTSDADGVLQDVHWAAGLIGYFPTYAIGNLVAAQLWERARVDIGDLDSELAAGELSPLREWLREHVHRHGSKFTTASCWRASPAARWRWRPFVSYLKEQAVAGVRRDALSA